MEPNLLIVTVIAVHLLALISPGPNFFISAQYGLNYPRPVGLLTTAGVATGTFIHVLLGLLGLSAIVAQSIWLYSILKFLGAAYLIYLGAKSLLSKGEKMDLAAVEVASSSQFSKRQAYQVGILTCLSNPKAAVYYLALFTSLILPGAALTSKVILMVILPIMSWLWYSLVVYGFSLTGVKDLYRRFRRWIDLAFGALLMGLGLKIILSTK